MGARRLNGTRQSWKDITAPFLSACSGTSTLLKCYFLRAKDISNGSLGFLLWSLLWAEKLLASPAKKPVAAIKEKAVYSKPSTPYDRPVGVGKKMAPLRCGCELSLPTRRAWRRREKSYRSDLVFESLPHRKTATTPNEPILCYLHDGPKCGFFREELLIVPADTELLPLERWYSIGSPISSKS